MKLSTAICKCIIVLPYNLQRMSSIPLMNFRLFPSTLDPRKSWRDTQSKTYGIATYIRSEGKVLRLHRQAYIPHGDTKSRRGVSNTKTTLQTTLNMLDDFQYPRYHMKSKVQYSFAAHNVPHIKRRCVNHRLRSKLGTAQVKPSQVKYACEPSLKVVQDLRQGGE